MSIVHIAIGNSDDKLSQYDWSSYIQELRRLVNSFADRVHGVWYSSCDSVYQNCCIAAEVSADLINGLRLALSDLRRKYKQDSVALNVSETEFV